MELHHLIMSKLWDPGGQTKRKERKTYKNPNLPQNIPSEIKNKIRTVALEEILYSQMVMIWQKTEVKKDKISQSPKKRNPFKNSQKDPRIASILILTRLEII